MSDILSLSLGMLEQVRARGSGKVRGDGKSKG